MGTRELIWSIITLSEKELRRFMRIWVQTLVPPAVTTSLYFVIFGSLIGPRIGAMDGFDYIEFEIDLVDCSFEKFRQFVNRLEKNDKIFVIDRFEFENSVGRGVQKALQNDGIFPGKNISMKIWAINLNKSSPSNIKKKGSI